MELADNDLKRMTTRLKILLMHYAPTDKTLEGENLRFFPTMGSRAYENVINARKPTLVIHGHSQHGIRQAWVDTVPVFNVAFAINKGVVLIDTDKLRPGLSRFV